MRVDVVPCTSPRARALASAPSTGAPPTLRSLHAPSDPALVPIGAGGAGGGISAGAGVTEGTVGSAAGVVGGMTACLGAEGTADFSRAAGKGLGLIEAIVILWRSKACAQV
jgi:hypothetical protein